MWSVIEMAMLPGVGGWQKVSVPAPAARPPHNSCLSRDTGQVGRSDGRTRPRKMLKFARPALILRRRGRDELQLSGSVSVHQTLRLPHRAWPRTSLVPIFPSQFNTRSHNPSGDRGHSSISMLSALSHIPNCRTISVASLKNLCFPECSILWQTGRAVSQNSFRLFLSFPKMRVFYVRQLCWST